MWKLVRVWILSSWSFLTIGILLGSWWAYHELGWGGWWFWDPVENASLMPWLLATACIHSITKPKLNYWTLIFTQTTFILSVLGTFFVRSGLLSSVHSFATDSTRGLYLLLFFLFITIISVFNWISFCFNTRIYGILSRFKTNLGFLLHSKHFFRFWPRLWSHFEHRSHSFLSLFKMPQFPTLRSKLTRLRIQFCKNAPSGPLSPHHRPQVFLERLPEVSRETWTSGTIFRETPGNLSGESSTRNWVRTANQKRTMKSARSVHFLRKRKKPEGDAFGKGGLAYEKPEGDPTRAGSDVTLARANKTTAPVFLSTEFPDPKGIEGTLTKALSAKGGLFFSEMKKSIEQILFLQNFYLCIICIVVFCGTSAPLFFQWLWGRDVGTGAPFYNAICIPLFTSVFFVLTYVHYIQFSLVNRLVLYCIFFFLVHVGLCVQIIGFNFLESIYAAICFLLISSILLSTCLRGPNSSAHNTFMTSFLSLPSRHLVLSPNWKACSQNFKARTQLFPLLGVANVNCDIDDEHIKVLKQHGTMHSYLFQVRPYSHMLESPSVIPSFQPQNEAHTGHSSQFPKGVFGDNLLLNIDSFTSEDIISHQPQPTLSTQSSATALRPFSFRFPAGRGRSVICNLQTNGKTKTIPSLLEELTILIGEKRPLFKAIHSQGVLKKNEKEVAIMPTKIDACIGSGFSMRRIKVIHATGLLDGSLQMSIAHIGLVIFIIGILFSNVFKFEFTQQLHSGPSGIHLGSQVCCLRSIDHSFAPTYHSICANLLVYKQANIESSRFFTGSLSRIVHNMKQALEGARFDHQGTELCMFPEKRFYYLNDAVQGGPNAGSLASKVAIQSNFFTDFYTLIGTGSFETGWFTTIMKLPFIFCIWLGFLFGVIGGVLSLKKQLQKPTLYWP